MTKSFQAALLTAVAAGALGAGAGPARAATYLQTDLVSDLSTFGAEVVDPNLKNSWGLSFQPNGPLWVSDQGTQNATLYGVTGAAVTKEGLTVAVPPSRPGALGPTGQVANTNTSAFEVTGTGKSALFIFANLNGSISAWNGSAGTTAVTETTASGAAYTGLAINQAGTMLYAANGAGAGGIDVFNSSFAPAPLPAGAFATPAAVKTAGLVPFNVKDIDGKVYVTYAPAGHAAEISAAKGMGALAVFSEDGTLESSSFVADQLASPWGLALAPSDWGQFGGDLLIGNFSFGDSVIDALNPTTFALEGTIAIDVGGQSPGGLWSLTFGGGGSDGNPDTLFITDGLNGEKDGLLASITAVPEPSTWAMAVIGFAGLALFAAGRRHRLAKAQAAKKNRSKSGRSFWAGYGVSAMGACPAAAMTYSRRRMQWRPSASPDEARGPARPDSHNGIRLIESPSRRTKRFEARDRRRIGRQFLAPSRRFQWVRRQKLSVFPIGPCERFPDPGGEAPVLSHP